MARRKQPQTPKPPAEDAAPPVSWDSQVFTGGANLHDLFTQQARDMLDRTDLDERAKQAILVAMNCPCCGAGGMNYTAKITRLKK
jgi:hypothetical protein